MRHSAKSIIAFILAFILCAGAFPFAALAEETEEPAEEERGSYSWYDPEADTLYISSIDELKEFTKLTRGDVTLDGTVIAKTDYAGKTVKLELCRGGRARIERLLKMVEFGRIRPGRLVTHRLDGFDRITDGLEMMREKTPELIKVMVVPEWAGEGIE